MTTCSLLEETSKTIRISFKTYKKLSELRTFGDSFDSIINNLFLNHDERFRGENFDKIPIEPEPDTDNHSRPTLPTGSKEARAT